MTLSKAHDVILLVDDDPVIRILMRKALTSSVELIIEASNGEEAIELFKRYSPDLILLDVSMDNMDGFECCSIIRALPEGDNVAIIMVTALDQPQDIQKAFDVGATDFMTKPVKWPLLSHRIQYVLKANKTIKELTNSKNKLAKAQSIAHLGSWEWDFKTESLDCSDEVYRMVGIAPHQAQMTLSYLIEVVHPEDREFVRSTVLNALQTKQPYDIEYRVLNTSGEVITVHDVTDITFDFGEPKLNGTLHDITTRKKTEQEISYYAFYDTLTDLPNRRKFLMQLDLAIANAQRHTTKLALLFIDLDYFKKINDTLGHKAGDELLCQAAQRIKDSIRASDPLAVGERAMFNEQHIARLGGDEFTLILSDLSDFDSVAIIAQRIIDSLSKPYFIQGHKTFISASIGISFYPDDGITADILLQHADTAMYEVKNNGKNSYQLFSHEKHQSLMARLKTEAELREAIQQGGQLELYYQPQFNSVTSQTVGYEALLRWNHPTKGILSPIDFMAVAENSGLIIEIGKWVLVEACTQAKMLQDKHIDFKRMAVNLSALQFNDENIYDYVKFAIEHTQVSPHLLELEITESAIIRNVDDAIALLIKLKDLGVKLAIDDFGTGYSSLNYLRNFPIDTLKIDKSFVDEIVTNQKDAAIARTIIQLAINLELSTIAEGVEHTEQLEILKSLGCNDIQGYLYSKALPAKKLWEE
ncbi:EAL domain-containing protein [Shewanella saliphila]|uniref:Two-component system response regulator n=1 Tax=Shewanella saliphila TaxID=2282698 RepID=A0ABQ2Q066_9GAMM|nr:EAL domain-containing protein [Shewanella saliphila]MCL1100369.1 EAL domain-containing protein [Shewanella saliphila]GGP37507.1 two-component system response regulator [Shewanella saliphila]